MEWIDIVCGSPWSVLICQTKKSHGESFCCPNLCTFLLELQAINRQWILLHLWWSDVGGGCGGVHRGDVRQLCGAIEQQYEWVDVDLWGNIPGMIV